ncbi:MAG: DUF4234 domain-containing protein [Verrucomicrobiota bacterium]
MNPESAAPAAGEPEVFFYPTVTWKFVLLSIFTLGIYEIYWVYKCWSFVKANGRPNIRPFWRAIFTPLWIYPLYRQISAGENKGKGVIIALSYFVISGLHTLPDPYTLVSSLSFILLLPVLKMVNAMNLAPEVQRASNYSRFKWYHMLISLVGGGLGFLAVTSSFLIIPSTYVVEGRQVPGAHRSFLMELDILRPDEEIIYFYSGGVFSLKEDGNYITDQRVVSYWENDLKNGYFTDVAEYAEIADVVVYDADSEWQDTEIVISLKDENQFALYVSAESGLDEKFVAKLRELWTQAKASK